MRKGILRATRLAIAAAAMPIPTSAVATEVPMHIPEPAEGPQRAITTDDLIGLRDIDTLSVSPDGSRYAILVRRADAAANTYRTGWFVGATAGGPLTFVGDGGEAWLRESPDGRRVGIIIGSPGRWSLDGQWLAFTARRGGEVQIRLARADGSGARQLTRHAADIRDFAWSDDGSRLLFTAGTSRAALAARLEAQRRAGFLLEDFQFASEIIHDPQPVRPLETDLAIWSVGADGGEARAASADERAMFERARARNFSWGRSQPQGITAGDLGGAAAPPIAAGNGSLVWLTRINPNDQGPLPFLRLTASRSPDGSGPLSCTADSCVGQMFAKIWWSPDGRRVIFWRKEDVNLVENGFYSWSPDSGDVRPIYRHDGDEFRECELVGARLICAREMVNRPAHVAAINVEDGSVTVLADVNPEYRSIRLGHVERFEWDAPEDVHDIGYPRRVFGYIIYPPDFDATRRYPVFIAPYGAPGFRRGDVGNEHPLFAYAANGFVVLSTQFPIALGSIQRSLPSDVRVLYDPERDFPHLSMLAGSTFRALDAVSSRGFLDLARVGIGGLSHGSFVPTYMAQTEDRLAAISISGPSWSQWQYYSPTRTGRASAPAGSQWPESREFWSRIDIADHVEEVEAPMMVNYADREFFHDWRLPRRMEDGGRAYEAHIYPDEYHVKWQPAHLHAIHDINLDWFRFWLQDVEDPDPAKAEQYARWRELRRIQCRNPRSLRDYCRVESRQAPIAR